VAPDSAFATVVLTPDQVSNYLVASGMNYVIPPQSTINGIEVSVTRKEGNSVYGVMQDSSVKIVKNGAITGTEHSAGTTWNTTLTTVTYGSSTDLWGTTWTPADINAANFGAAIAVTEVSSRGTSETAYVDHMTITVYYAPPGSCTKAAATVSITPASQNITTDGGTAAYTVSITNNDVGPCGTATFTLPVTNSNNTDFAVPANLSPVTLAPGANTTVPLNVTAVAGKLTGTTISSVTATEATHASGASNSVTTNISVTPCIRTLPTVSLAPASGTISADSGTMVYTLTITNNDSGCASETFNLTKSDSNSTAFNASVLSAPSVTLAAGASSSAVTLTVSAQAGQTTGTNTSSVTAASANHANVTSSNVTTTLNVCATNVPTLTLAPASQTITTNGGFVEYTLSMTNNDALNCSNTTFNLSAVDTNGTAFDPSATNPASVTLAPGASTTVNLRVTAKSGATSGSNTTHVNSARQGQAHMDPSNTVTTLISVVPCVANTPSISIAPTTHTISTDSGTAAYTVTITNNDSGGCSNTTFALPVTNSDSVNFSVPATLAPVTLATGASTTVPLTVTAVAGKTSGSTGTSVSATAAGHASAASNTVSTTLNVVVCTQPAAQAITPGGTIDYTVKVKNTDTSVCPSSTFSLSVVSDSNSADFNTPSVLDTTSLNLAPGQIGTAKLTVISKGTAPNGAFNDTAIGVSEAGHTAPADVTVRTTVAPVSPLMHNSINTESSKWAAENGWGIPGGKYGEFECKTCHTLETTNIKRIKGTITAPNGTDTFPGSSVIFGSTTTPDGFGDDADLHTTSTKICEVCHSQTLYHRFNTQDPDAGGPLTGQTIFDHNNSTDCTACHKHSAAFKASCGSCHGNPPVDPATLVFSNGSGPASTNSATAGAHASHVAKSIGCESCHVNSVGTGAEHNNSLTVTLGFSLFNGGIKAGAYNGQTGVLYNSSDAGTTVSNDGLKQCSNIYCHGSSMAPNGGTNITPTWDDPATGACGTCHGATAAAPPTRGMHQKHAGSWGSNWGREFACTMCHNTAAGQHINNKSEVVFSADPRLSGAGYSGTDTMLDAYGNCSNLYCHSNVQTSPPGGPVTYRTVNWGDPQTYACNICHEGPDSHAGTDPMTGNTTGSHAKHASFNRFGCVTCHTNDAAIDPTAGPDCNGCHSAVDQNVTHTNGVINVSIVNIYGGTYSGDPAPGTPYGGCSTVYCHSSGQSSTGGSLTAGDYKAVNWGGAVLDCASCHKDMDTDPAATGSHVQHAQGAANYNCALCHDGNTETTYANATHVNKSINLSFSGPAGGATYSQGNIHAVGDGYGSCSVAACHGSTPSPAWGTDFTGIDSCTRCHGTPTAGVAPDYAKAPNLGAHQNHMNPTAMAGYISPSLGCSECHVVPATVLAAGHITDATPGIAEINLSGRASLNGVSPTYGATCSVYCHGVAMPRGTTDGANRTPSWTDSGYITGVASHDCAQCHGYPPAGISAHIGKGPADCHTCHSNVNATGTGFTTGGLASHIDGIVLVSADSCTDCHSSAGGPTAGSTPDAYHAKHVQTAYVGALSAGDYGNYTTNTWYAYSNTGGVPDMGCGYCHPQSAATHNNGSIDLNMANNDTGAAGTLKAKNAATESFTQTSRTSVTCSSVYCHSNGYGLAYTYQTTPNWYGGTFTDKCSACHGNSPNSGGSSGSPAHGAHLVGIHYNNIFSGTTGKLAAGGATGAAHGDPTTSTTINCNVCHNSTVTVANNDGNTVCATCHDGTNAPNKGAMVIDAASTSHINGTPDVSFGGFSVNSKSQLRDSIASVAELNNSWTRTNGYKAASSHDASKRTPAFTGGTCSTVDCHNGNSVGWNSTGPLSCDACHTALPQ